MPGIPDFAILLQGTGTEEPAMNQGTRRRGECGAGVGRFGRCAVGGGALDRRMSGGRCRGLPTGQRRPDRGGVAQSRRPASAAVPDPVDLGRQGDTGRGAGQRGRQALARRGGIPACPRAISRHGRRAVGIGRVVPATSAGNAAEDASGAGDRVGSQQRPGPPCPASKPHRRPMADAPRDHGQGRPPALSRPLADSPRSRWPRKSGRSS